MNKNLNFRILGILFGILSSINGALGVESKKPASKPAERSEKEAKSTLNVKPASRKANLSARSDHLTLRKIRNNILIYKNTKSTQATKARAAQNIERDLKQLKIARNKTRASAILKRNGVTEAEVTASSKKGNNLLKLNRAAHQFALRRKENKVKPNQRDSHIADVITTNYNDLDTAQKSEAQKNLKKQNVDLANIQKIAAAKKTAPAAKSK